MTGLPRSMCVLFRLLSGFDPSAKVTMILPEKSFAFVAVHFVDGLRLLLRVLESETYDSCGMTGSELEQLWSRVYQDLQLLCMATSAGASADALELGRSTGVLGLTVGACLGPVRLSADGMQSCCGVCLSCRRQFGTNQQRRAWSKLPKRPMERAPRRPLQTQLSRISCRRSSSLRCPRDSNGTWCALWQTLSIAIAPIKTRCACLAVTAFVFSRLFMKGAWNGWA